MVARYSLTALDCPDALALANFYAALCGARLGDVEGDAQWVEIIDPAGRVLAFQRVEKYVAPTWPQGDVPQQFHLDFNVDDLDVGEAEVLARFSDPGVVRVFEAFEEAGLVPAVGEISWIPENSVPVQGEEAEKVLRLIERLEDVDDVQNVYANFEVSDALVQKMSA